MYIDPIFLAVVGDFYRSKKVIELNWNSLPNFHLLSTPSYKVPDFMRFSSNPFGINTSFTLFTHFSLFLSSLLLYVISMTLSISFLLLYLFHFLQSSLIFLLLYLSLLFSGFFLFFSRFHFLNSALTSFFIFLITIPPFSSQSYLIDLKFFKNLILSLNHSLCAILSLTTKRNFDDQKSFEFF